MAKQNVKGHKRNGKTVKPYSRKKRKSQGTKKIVGKKPVTLYPVRDEFGQWKGYAKKKK